MAIRDIADILKDISDMFGDDLSDDKLRLLEDITDTVAAATPADGEDWKSKYEENDRAWRQKYKDRFLNKEEVKVEVTVGEDQEDEFVKKSYDYDDLFEEKE